MPSGKMREIPEPNDNFLLDDTTLGMIWDKLFREFKVSRDQEVHFLSWIGEPSTRLISRKGIFVKEAEVAWFLVVSPSPNKADDPLVRTYGSTPLADYYDALKEWGHFANRPHPAESIFRHLLRQHLRSIGALTGLTEIDESAYEETLRQSHWVLEQAQGSRYEKGITTLD